MRRPPKIKCTQCRHSFDSMVDYVAHLPCKGKATPPKGGGKKK